MKHLTSTPHTYGKVMMALALDNADHNQPTLYHSRIDGMLLPAGDYRIEVAPINLSSIAVGRVS